MNDQSCWRSGQRKYALYENESKKMLCALVTATKLYHDIYDIHLNIAFAKLYAYFIRWPEMAAYAGL